MPEAKDASVIRIGSSDRGQEKVRKPTLGYVISQLTNDFIAFDRGRPPDSTFCGMDLATFADQMGPEVFFDLQATVRQMAPQARDTISSPQTEGIVWFATKIEKQHRPHSLSLWRNNRIVRAEDVRLSFVDASAVVSEDNVNVLDTNGELVNELQIIVSDLFPSHAEALLNEQVTLASVIQAPSLRRSGDMEAVRGAYERYANLWPTRLNLEFMKASRGDARRAVLHSSGVQLLITRMLRQPGDQAEITARWVYSPRDMSRTIKTPMVTLPIVQETDVEKFEGKLTALYNEIASRCRSGGSRSFLGDHQSHEFMQLDA